MSLIPKHANSLKDHFLMATPALSGGFFAKSLTYICEHNALGAMGIVINQPLGIPLAEIFEQLDLGAGCGNNIDQAVLAGGPVQVEHGFLLHDEAGSWESTLQIGPGTWLTTSKDILEGIANGDVKGHVLMALGYAGCRPGSSRMNWLTMLG